MIICPQLLFEHQMGEFIIDIVEYMPTNRGKGVLLIFNGFTYAHRENRTRFYCSKKAIGCKARLTTTEEGNLLEVVESKHNHAPPKLYRTNDGKVYKL
ncbi:hypothetical protein KGM_208279 [Danaus plexippus plexippus]|uniref:FLYWCH-type domain-containing protein n=1 Tax=Danaus plexippus plexippus TaxID=278856 RepID=A0A212EXN3_DANPL|nr:hypothetical protein KGM_208279 [Danaus plexippus plexippus]